MRIQYFFSKKTFKETRTELQFTFRKLRCVHYIILFCGCIFKIYALFKGRYAQGLVHKMSWSRWTNVRGALRQRALRQRALRTDFAVVPCTQKRKRGGTDAAAAPAASAAAADVADAQRSRTSDNAPSVNSLRQNTGGHVASFLTLHDLDNIRKTAPKENNVFKDVIIFLRGQNAGTLNMSETFDRQITRERRKYFDLMFGRDKRHTHFQIPPEVKQSVTRITMPHRASLAAIQRCVSSFPNLKSLELNNRRKITDSSLGEVLRLCPHLQELDLSSCKKITTHAVKTVARLCPHLQKLDLSYCKKITSDPGLIWTPLRQCPHLKELYLTSCENILDNGLAWMAEACPNLETLYVQACEKITDAGMRVVAQNCPRLQRVYLCRGKFTDSVLRALAQGCPQLQELVIPGCYFVTDNGLRALAQGCKHLRLLDIETSIRITDPGLGLFLGGCQELESLNLGECHEITDNGMLAVALQCPHLQRLRFAENNHITDAGVAAVAEACIELQSLDLVRCPHITDLGLTVVAEQCEHLTDLDLSGCEGITIAGVAKLAELRPNLAVYCEGCKNITDDNVRDLRTRFPDHRIRLRWWGS